MFVCECGYTVAEHHIERPWIVLDQRHETVELEDGTTFYEWAASYYAHHCYTVQLDPWSLSTGD
jgi:hypothetical protein